MPENTRLTLRQADQAREDFAAIAGDLDFIKAQLPRLATRREVWRAVLMGMVCGAAAARGADRGILPVMLLNRILVLACSLALGPSLARAREYRVEVKHEFQRQHPCPSTGRTTGACPGYIKDDILPLACGGPDSVANLQWQTIADSKAKDKWEAEIYRPLIRRSPRRRA